MTNRDHSKLPPDAQVATTAPGWFEPDLSPPCDVTPPKAQLTPLVVSSPHSGNVYPARFLATSRLDALTLRRSEDAYVDELFGPAAALGAPLQFDRVGDGGGPLRERTRHAASPDGAFTSSGRAARATPTSAAKASGSLIAMSDRFLRSTSTPASLRPWISRL